MTLYCIYWYPKCPGDYEKNCSYVLCNNQQEAWKIADKYYKKVQVSEVCSYASIAGGREGEEYWASLVMYKGRVLDYREYEELKNRK